MRIIPRLSPIPRMSPALVGAAALALAAAGLVGVRVVAAESFLGDPAWMADLGVTALAAGLAALSLVLLWRLHEIGRAHV